jgi:hypothetical protein
MDLGVAPLVLRISLGQAVAFLKGRRACRADLTGGSLSNRASDGERGQPRAAMVVASPSFVVALANNLLSALSAMSWPQIGCRSCQA